MVTDPVTPLTQLLVDRAAPAVARFASRGGVPLIAGVLAGGTMFALAILDDRRMAAGFYSLCAQVFPVFVVALVVERRLADRLKLSENDWVQQSWEAFDAYMSPPSLPPDEYEGYEAFWCEKYADFTWVLSTGPDDLAVAARARYRQAVAVESATILFAVVALVVGQVASLVGVAANGTGPNSSAYVLTTSTLAASFTVIVASAIGELFRNIARGTALGVTARRANESSGSQ